MLTESILATRTSRMGASAIREILKVVSRPGMVSLAGGIPSPQAFPMDLMASLLERVLQKYDTAAFQYGATEGFGPLREALVPYLRSIGTDSTVDRITISTGSQGALDALAKVVVSPGDVIAVESPTYLGALQAFQPYEPTYVEMETDGHGVLPESVEEVIRNHQPKMVYLVPTFQNPSGKTIPLTRRKEIAEIAIRTNTLIVEDDPYGQLRYSGKAIPPIHSFAPDQTVYCGTFSKVCAPGIRVGFTVAPPALSEWLVKAKQGVDLHTSSLSQALAAEFLAGGHLAEHLPKIIKLYKPRMETMLRTMDESFPEACTWTKPEGGMFVWVQGPIGLDAVELYRYVTERYHVAFVPGTYFFAIPETGKETMRLNFTMSDEKTLRKAVALLGQAIHETIN